MKKIYIEPQINVVALMSKQNVLLGLSGDGVSLEVTNTDAEYEAE